MKKLITNCLIALLLLIVMSVPVTLFSQDASRSSQIQTYSSSDQNDSTDQRRLRLDTNKLNLDASTLKDVNISFFVGLAEGSDYGTSLTNAFENSDKSLSGFKGWVSLGMKLEIRVINSFYITPSVTASFSRIKVPSAYLPSFLSDGKSYINGLYSFGLGATYCIKISKSMLSLHYSWLSNLSGADSDLRKYAFDYKPEGSGYKVSAGWILPTGANNSAYIELGYSRIPMKVTDPGNSYLSSTKNASKNFGGVFLNIGGNLGLFNY